MSPRHLTLLAFVAAVAAVGCVGEPTSIRLALDYEDAWGLTDLTVRIGEREQTVPVEPSLEVWVPDGWSGAEVRVEVVGLRDGQRVAVGRALVIPRRAETVDAEVTLTRVVCGDWCVEGATECRGDAVVACAIGADGCARLDETETCAMGCSFGECRADCIDECAMGEVQCAGPAGVRRCGEGDSDTCLDWLPPEPCADGQSCSAGQCVDGCADACDADGVTTCLSGGIATCGDLNVDGCLEWSPIASCGDGSSCTDGACVSGCTDECDKDVCAEDSQRICGQFDLDSCLDLSPGMSCRRPGTCEVGTCGEDGCEVAPVVCDAPPANSCVDAGTLRTYSAVGTCAEGDCDYPFEDRACPNCPACDACAGVTCDAPPAATCADADTRRSFAPNGACDGGSCSYPAVDEDCDDPPSDTCVDADTRRTFAPAGTCAMGTCDYAVTDEDCTSPPAPTCVDATTRRSFGATGTCTAGSCSYVPTDEVCPAGCVAGACSAAMCTPFGTDTFGYRGCSIAMTPGVLPCPDIRATGTATGIGDDAQQMVPIGFGFTFYGASYTNVAIQSNGALTFTPDTNELDYRNECLPYTTGLNPLIATLWDDVDPTEPGADVYYQTRGASPGRTFQVQWNAPLWRSGGGGDPGWWSVILHETSNRVELCYHDVDFMDPGKDNGASATVGIQSASSSLSFSCNMGALSSGLYLELTPP